MCTLKTENLSFATGPLSGFRRNSSSYCRRPCSHALGRWYPNHWFLSRVNTVPVSICYSGVSVAMRSRVALYSHRYKIAHFSADLRSTPQHPDACYSLLRSVMTNETSPLLPENRSTHCVEYGLPKKTESTYDRFTPARKRMILALVSLAGMIPCESRSFFSAAYVAD